MNFPEVLVVRVSLTYRSGGNLGVLFLALEKMSAFDGWSTGHLPAGAYISLLVFHDNQMPTRRVYPILVREVLYIRTRSVERIGTTIMLWPMMRRPGTPPQAPCSRTK